MVLIAFPNTTTTGLHSLLSLSPSASSSSKHRTIGDTTYHAISLALPRTDLGSRLDQPCPHRGSVPEKFVSPITSQSGFTTARYERLALQYCDLHPLRAHHGDITLRSRVLSRQRKKSTADAHARHVPTRSRRPVSKLQKVLNISNATTYLVSVTQTKRDSDIIALIMLNKRPINISYLYVDASSSPAGRRPFDRPSTRKMHVGDDVITSGPGRDLLGFACWWGRSRGCQQRTGVFEWTAGAKLAALESWKGPMEAPSLLCALSKPDDDDVGMRGWKTGGNCRNG
ncbi:hypothetical protein RhiJN_23777 [Ceratobasidium sp. AG-Ba]|nr:hypothetical protein RhiJN_23777 [Ceratobasidium sp. AG-Ba]